MGGSSRLPLLSKAGEPWPGTCLCVLLAWGEPEPFVPGFVTGGLHWFRILSCCMAFKGCRDQRL